MPSRLQQTLEAARRAVERRDRDLAYEMAKSYADTWRRLQADLARLLADPDSDPAREARLHELISQAEAEFARWAQWAAGRIRREFPDVAAAADEHAAALAAAMAPTGQAGEILAGAWNRINHRALAEMVAITSPASPVMELFENLGTHAADTIASGLRAGIAQGWNPRKTARHIRDALGGDLNRALTVARTETMRAYREATRQSYLANSDIVDGWIWTAHPSTRTCAACWAMDGTHHKLDEPLGSHPRCRCTMVPELAPWGDIHPALAGLGELNHPTGAERFAQLSEADQRAILGPSRYEAYRDGRLTIDDHPDTGVVQRRDDPVWGTTRTVRPVRDIPQNAPEPPPVPQVTAANMSQRVAHAGPMPNTGAEVDRALDKIGEVLDVPDDGHRIPVSEGRMAGGWEGGYSTHFDTLTRALIGEKIEIDQATLDAAGTFVHEYGHYLDSHHFPGAAARSPFATSPGATGTDPAFDAAMARVMDAAQRSAGWRRIEQQPNLANKYDYWLSPEEVWARAFHQWVATRTGDQAMLARIIGDPRQWDPADFAPIADAIDDVFRALGWLKPGVAP